MAQAIVQRSYAKLRSASRDDSAMMRRSFACDLQEMMKALEVIQPVLEDAERHSLWDEPAREWLRRVRNAAYGISDMVDELQDTRAPVVGTMTGFAIRPKKNHMASKMKGMKQELRMLQGSHRFASMPENIGDQRIMYVTKAPPPQPIDSLPPPPPPLPEFTLAGVEWGKAGHRRAKKERMSGYEAPQVVEWGKAGHRRAKEEKIVGNDEGENIVGRGENKQSIMAILSASDITEGPIILPIFGLAAIGKTTLAAMVFRDTRFRKYNFRIWVDVPPTFDLHNIGKIILSEILKKINFEEERGHHSQFYNKVSEEELNQDTDGTSQESDEDAIQFTYSSCSTIEEEISEGSNGASEVSDRHINRGSDVTSQVSEEEINGTSPKPVEDITYRSSHVLEEQINKDSDGSSQVSAEHVNRGSDVTSQVSEEEINGTSPKSVEDITYRSSHVLEEEINEDSDGSSQVSDEHINRGSDVTLEVSEEEINRTSPKSVEDINQVTYRSSQLVEEEIIKGSDGASQVSKKEINLCTYETSPKSVQVISQVTCRSSHVLEEEIDKDSDGDSNVSEKEMNQGTDGTSKVSEEEVNKGIDNTSQVEEEMNKGSGGASRASEEGVDKGIEEINQVVDGTSQVLVEVNPCSHRRCEVSELKMNYCSDGIPEILEEEINYGSDETSQVSEGEEEEEEEEEINHGLEEEIKQGSHGVEYITKRLHELLNGMQVLIVLDDLWEEDSAELERLKCMLGVGINGSKVIVIVTTCNEGIARKVCTVKPYKLDPLTNDMCWTIIKEQSCFADRCDSDKQELERIGRQIASKCWGLPLAAKELGRSLRHRHARGWAEAMNRDIWSDIQTRNGVIRSLELSYRSMPPDLRLCFAYCAIFPQGDNVAKHDIIHQWIALGLVDPSDTLSATQVAEEYIGRLLDISFLQIAQSASTSGKGDMGAILLTMHELAHDLARLVGDELIVLDDRLGTPHEDKSCRYGLLTNFDVKLASKLPAQLRALRCVSCSKMELSDDAFSFVKCLRVLHLNECSMQKLPDSIRQLRRLGYLNLSGCSRLIFLPESFGDLLNLWYINLSGCSRLATLPESVGDLLNLRYFSLSRCHGLAELPESFGNLKKLVYLDLSFWSCFEGIPVLGGLSNLQHLNLSHPCCHLAQHWPHLQGLKDVLGKLTKLQNLNLSMCMNPISYYLSEEQCGEYIRSCTSGLSSLEHLDLSHNIFLADLPESLGELNRLKTLDLSGCIRLKRVPRWMDKMDSLKSIAVRNCRSLEIYPFVVRIDDGGFSSNLVQLEDVACQELDITCLENVKSAEEARRVRLIHKQKLDKLKLGWTVGSQGSVEDDALLGELEPPHDLQYLALHGYRGMCLPAWTLCISSHLPNLVEVTMEDFPRCRSLPPLGLLPNLQQVVLRKIASITRIDMDSGDLGGGGNTAAFHRRLTKFTIDDMESLEELNSTYYATDELVIQKCSKLSFGPLPPRSRRLLVSDCDQVIASPGKTRGPRDEEGPSFTSPPVTELVVDGFNMPRADWSLLRYLTGLQTLSISHCDGMTSLPQDMGHLNSLRNLQIVCCKQLNCLPDSMQRLTCLHSMHFSNCESLKALPEWFGALVSLQKLSIDRCNHIKSLPRSIRKLTNLKDLHIFESPTLKNWCELANNKKKLARIQPKYEEDGTSRLDYRCIKCVPSRPTPTSTWDYFFGP